MKRSRTLLSLLLVSALSFNLTAFGAESKDERVTACVSGEDPAAATDSDKIFYDCDFDGKEGNFLMAVNPEPWSSDYDYHYCDMKTKEQGYMEGAGTAGTDDKALKDTGHSLSYPHKCGSMYLKNKYPAVPEVKIRTAEDEITEYKVGDVLLRNVLMEFAGREGIDYYLATEIQEDYQSEWSPHVYQCLYTGDYSTIWGSVSVDSLTAEEMDAVDKMGRALYEAAKEDPSAGYDKTGLIGRTEDYNRTVPGMEKGLSRNDIEEKGRELDKYILKEKEFTGDYLVTDRKYGDNDKKAAFFLEPFNETQTYGYFWDADLEEASAGKSIMDCLHLNTDMVLSNDDYLYTTLLHELQHCIIFGYQDNDVELWIDELMAQGVSMQVYGQTSDDVKEYVRRLVKSGNLQDSYLIKPYAYGEDYEAGGDASSNNYSIAYPLTRYFEEHVDKKFVKTFTEKLSPCTTEEVTKYLKKNTAHSLEGWLACFSIALMAGIDGTDTNIEKGSDYDIGDSEVIQFCKEMFKENEQKVSDSLGAFGDIKKGVMIPGGGSMRGYINPSDRKAEILESEEGVVWALRNSKGEIVSVEGLDNVDGIDKRTFTGRTVSVNGSIPVNVNIKMLSSATFAGKTKPTAGTMDLRVSLEFKNAADRDKINIGKIGLGTLSFKNTGKVFQYDGSGNRKKNPSVKGLKLKALPGASADEKALVKAVNKAIKESLKKEYLFFDIDPCPLDGNPPEVTLNKDQTKIKKAVCFFGQKKYKLKKTEYEEILTDGKVTGIRGKENFTGDYDLYNGKRVVKVE